MSDTENEKSNELTIEEKQFVYSLLDNGAKSLGIQQKEQFDKCVDIGNKILSQIKEDTEAQKSGKK